MKSWTINDIFRFVGMLVLWGIAIVLGLTVFLTVAEGLIAFASTGIGAIILIIIGWKLYKNWKNEA